jgi:outer membrane protein OmpA-like peptidoglycan-associated protein
MTRQWWAVALLGLALAGTASAQRADPEVDPLRAELARLDADPSLGELAGVPRLQARQAIDAVATGRRRERPQRLEIARLRLEIAQAAAETELLQRQADQLDRERDQILLEASRREAEQARRDAERLRREALLREEEAERMGQLAESERLAREQSAAEAEAATAEAEAARRVAAARSREAELARREAELANALLEADAGAAATPPPRRRVGNRDVYTVSGSAFGSGRAQLGTAAQASLAALAPQLRNARSISVTGYSDSQGDDNANLALSRQRAEAVRQALVAAGVPAARVRAVGRGEADPVADNATAEGRARNRRVEISVE